MKRSSMVIAALMAALVLWPGEAGAQTNAAPSAGLTLAALEQLALAHNPTLRQAQDSVAAAAGHTRQAGLWPNPTVGYEGAEIRGGSFRGGEQGAFVQQDIVLGGKLAAARQEAAAAERQQQARAAGQRQAVRTAVQLAFYEALRAQQEVALRQRLLSIAEDAVHTTAQLANVGQADRPDQLEAQVEAGQAQLDLNQAQQMRVQAWSQLAATVGQPSLQPQPLSGDLATPPAPIQPQPYLLELLTQSPAMGVAQAAVAQAQATLRRAHKQPIPNLQLRGGVEANRELNELSRRPVGWQGFASVGVQLPLFNRNQGNIQAAVAELDRAQQELERVRLSLRAQAAPQLATYQAASQAVAQYRDTMLPRAQKAYQMYMKNYQNMAAAYPQVLVAQRSWFQAQTGYLAALAQLWRSAVTLRGYLLTQGLDPMGTAPAALSAGTMGGGQ